MARSIKERIIDNLSSFDDICALAWKNDISFAAAKLIYKYELSLDDAIEVSRKASKMSFIDRKKIEKQSYLKLSPKVHRRKVHGILLASETEDNLNKLERIINTAFRKGNKQFLEALTIENDKNPLFISDYDETPNKKNSYYLDDGDYICLKLPKKDYDFEWDNCLKTFYHEVSHYLDHKNSNYSSESQEVQKVFDELNNSLLNDFALSFFEENNIPQALQPVFMKTFNSFRIHLLAKGLEIKKAYQSEDIYEIEREFVENNELRQKWKMEIDEKYPHYSEEEKNQRFEQTIMEKGDLYFDLHSSVCDIYDALASGTLNSFLHISGHGVSYYSIKNNPLIEFIANIGAIYLANGEEVLTYEFGPKLTNDLINIYTTLIKTKETRLDQSEIDSLGKSPEDLDNMENIDFNLQDLIDGETFKETKNEELTPNEENNELKDNPELMAMLEDTPTENITNRKTM